MLDSCYNASTLDIVSSVAKTETKVSETRDIALPGVNMNGTSRAELFAQYFGVIETCDALLSAMRNAMPHGRDYQISPMGEYERARREMLERLQAVEKIKQEFTRLAQYVL